MDSTTETVVGVDVSVRRGLDVVVLDRAMRVVDARQKQTPDDLVAALDEHRPVCVAVDSPPGRGKLEPGSSSRASERELWALGINVFLTPNDPDRYAGPFYDWVRVGEQVYEAASRAGYEIQTDPDQVSGRALEVFPHATDVFLRGCLPPRGTTRTTAAKRDWRLNTLHAAGVATDRLCCNRDGIPTLDSVDAALIAVAANQALDGDYRVLGNPGEFVLVPGRRTEPFTRCPNDPDDD